MEVYDKIGTYDDGNVTLRGFTAFVRDTFSGTESDPQFEKRISMMFNKFSRTDPDAMSEKDFHRVWDRFMRRGMHPKTALIIVDFQNDFITGALATKNCPRGEDAETLIPALNKMVDTFEDVVYTYDWHPEGHLSFFESLGKRPFHKTFTEQLRDVKIGTDVVFDIGGEPVVQKMWPRHCVQNTHGAELHEKLKIKPNAITIRKGSNLDEDSYSAFWNNLRTSHTGLAAALRKRNVNKVFVAGLAYDVCVSFTALDAVSEGFMTSVIRDCTCAIANETTAEADSRLKAIHIPLITSSAIDKKTLLRPVPWVILWQQAEKFC